MHVQGCWFHIQINTWTSGILTEIKVGGKKKQNIKKKSFCRGKNSTFKAMRLNFVRFISLFDFKQNWKQIITAI